MIKNIHVVFICIAVQVAKIKTVLRRMGGIMDARGNDWLFLPIFLYNSDQLVPGKSKA